MVEATDEDYTLADSLMTQYCHEMEKRIPSSFTYKEATAVLANIARGEVAGATPGLVQALLDSDADVCFERRRSTNVLKVVMNRNQEDVRSNLFTDATKNCPADILLLLALTADDLALDSALSVALGQNSPEKVAILMARGANATPLCDPFLHAVDGGRHDIVEALLHQDKGACQSCRNKGLVRAASLGDVTNVRLLMEKGADATFDRAAALQTAIRNGKENAAALILSSGQLKGNANLLDSAVKEASVHKQYALLSACLQAGAKGPMVNSTLLEAVNCQNLECVHTLIDHGASVDDDTGAAVVSAFQSGNTQLLQAVLQGKPSASSMAAALNHTTSLREVKLAHHMIDLLLTAGLRGDPVSDIMIQVLNDKKMAGGEDSRLDLVYLLLRSGGANINHQGGRSLVLALAQGWIKIFRLLLQYQPSVESLKAVLEHAMTITNPDSRHQIVKTILDAGANNPVVTERLTTVAVASAARELRLDVLEQIVQSGASSSALASGFASLISKGRQWVTPPGLEVAQFLLDHGASGVAVDQAFCQAAEMAERDAFELLFTSIGPSALNSALLCVIEHSKCWCSPNSPHLWFVLRLLEWGANGESVNIALLEASKASAKGLASEALLDTLLTVGAADVNFMLGEALKVAIRAGNNTLLKKLINHNVHKETMTQAFSELVVTPLAEGMALELLEALAAETIPRESRPDFRTILSSRPPSIVSCLTAHPDSAKLVRRLVQLGCDLEATLEAQLYSSENPERITALLWALLPQKGIRPVSDAVVEVLINSKANVSFVTTYSRVSPLILAAKHGRSAIVKRLIEANADTYARDIHDRSALFYASREGDLDAVNALLKRQFKQNDGSLHEAARNLHSQVVAALIKSKFEANYPSTCEHEGRTPLQELAYRCDGTRPATDMEKTIMALDKGKADNLARWRGKNALFLALENANPCAITQTLLDLIMWQVIAHKDNLVELTQRSGIKYFMSPTVYLKMGGSQANPKATARLEQLLRGKNCPDRYFAESGALQPEGAVGLPDDIAQEIKSRREAQEKQKAREFEHQEKLRRQREEEDQRRAIEQSKHDMWQMHEYEKTTQKVNQSSLIHHNQYHQKLQITAQQNEALEQKNALVEQGRQRAQTAKHRPRS